MSFSNQKRRAGQPKQLLRAMITSGRALRLLNRFTSSKKMTPKEVNDLLIHIESKREAELSRLDSTLEKAAVASRAGDTGALASLNKLAEKRTRRIYVFSQVFASVFKKHAPAREVSFFFPETRERFNRFLLNKGFQTILEGVERALGPPARRETNYNFFRKLYSSVREANAHSGGQKVVRGIIEGNPAASNYDKRLVSTMGIYNGSMAHLEWLEERMKLLHPNDNLTHAFSNNLARLKKFVLSAK